MVAGGAYTIFWGEGEECPYQFKSHCGGSEMIEVIDLADESLVCDNLPEFPIKRLYGGTGGLLNEMPVICGGVNDLNRDDVSDQCYFYDETGSWKPFSQLDRPRAGSLSVKLDDKLWIIGGQNSSSLSWRIKAINESVFIFDNGTTKEGMKMPVDIINSFACSVQLENGTILVVPAKNRPWIDNTFIINPLTEEISSGPTLPRKTKNCDAIGFRSPAHGGRHVIAMLTYGEAKVEDGFRGRSSGFLDILDYTSGQRNWSSQKGDRHDPNDILGELVNAEGSNTKLLPSPSGDGFIALDGVPDGRSKKFVQFKCTLTGCEWTRMTQQLKEIHMLPVVMYIPNSLTNCREKNQEELQLETEIKELCKKRRENWTEFILFEKQTKAYKNANGNIREKLRDELKMIERKLEEAGEVTMCG